ncbi:MAG: hypothetical protein Q9227_001423 [Pyrenula ochraceoflavens]
MPSSLPPNIVLVLSGKGGVGKSSVTIQLALSLTSLGHNVGILDVDLTGPSIPRMLGLESSKVTQVAGGWNPVRVYGPSEQDINGTKSNIEHLNGQGIIAGSHGALYALSLAFLLPSRSSAVVWRGPKKTAMIRQFLSDAVWPADLDYLLIDTPPGTSDEHISLVEEMHKLADSIPQAINGHTERVAGRLRGAVVVTTPQAVATSDVRKELNFCETTQVPVLGVLENMSGYSCPCCGDVSNVFSSGGGKVMAQETNVEFLGQIPIDTTLEGVLDGKTHDETTLIARYLVECRSAPILKSVAKRVAEKVQRGS